MAKNKLFVLLETFTKNEWKQFGRFLKMKTSKGTDVDRLYAYCYKTYRSSKKSDLSIESIKRKILKKNSDKSVLNALSTMTEYAREFIVYQSILSDQREKDIRLITEYNRRGLFVWANKLADRTIKKLQEDESLSLYQADARKRICHNQYFSENPIKNQSGTSLLRDLIRTFSLSTKEYAAFYSTELINRGKALNIDYSNELEELKSDIVVQSNTYDTLIVLSNFVQNQTKTSFESLWNGLKANAHIEDSLIPLVTLLHLIKFAMEQLKSGDTSYSEVIFKLYTYGIDSGLMLERGKIPELRYQNMINSLVGLSRSTLVIQFIENYTDIVNTDQIEENHRLAMAQISYFDQDYEEVIQLLNQTRFHSKLQEMRLRAFLAISHTESSDNEFAKTYVDNFKRFIDRHKKEISQTTFTGNKNLAAFLLAVLSNKSYQELHNTYHSYDKLSSRKWCNQKLEEIRKSQTKSDSLYIKPDLNHQ